MKQNFIKTSDADTAERLRSLHFTELPPQGNFFVFLNDKSVQFSESENKKLVFTNAMNM